jgi:uncharacterized protein (DUF3820 family)
MIPALTDNDRMPFGKYKGTAMINVPAKYLLWLLDEGVSHNGVRQYIIANQDALTKEAAKTRR